MKMFYDKLDEARDAKTVGEAIGALTEAYAISLPLVKQARMRLEPTLAYHITSMFKWSAALCIRKFSGEDPSDVPFSPLFGGGGWWGRGGTNNSSSLDWRWKQSEFVESWLPSVPCWTRGP